MNSEVSKLPRHIAVIMDGNGRWARQRDLPRIEGHRAGVRAVRETVRTCRELGIRHLTLYAFSVENWKRPRAEISALMRLLTYYLKAEINEMRENGIRLGIIGDWNRLSKGVRKGLQKAMDGTAGGTDMDLHLALSYGGRDEIIRAVRRIGESIEAGEVAPGSVNEESFSRYLDTAQIPDPDLLIRTSGEHRVSNFLLWQIAYTEMYVTPVLWPDFGRKHLMEALEDYARRERRFGGVEPDAAL